MRNKYKRINQFRAAVKAEAVGSAVWARRSTSGTPKGDASLQVDVEAIPLVRPLNVGGELKS